MQGHMSHLQVPGATPSLNEGKQIASTLIGLIFKLALEAEHTCNLRGGQGGGYAYISLRAFYCHSFCTNLLPSDY